MALGIIFTLGALAIAAVTVILYFNPDILAPEDYMIDLGGVVIVMTHGQMCAMLGFMAVLSILSAALFHQLRGFLRDVSECYTPFTGNNCDRLRNISIVLVAIGVLTVLFLCMPVGPVEPTPDTLLMLVPTLLIAIIVYCISLAFRYGTLLQQESDETL